MSTEPTNNPSTTTSVASHAPTPPSIYATIDEYAERLKVSRGTVFSWLNAGLPSIKAGATRRIIVARADAWLEAGGADRHRKTKRTRRPSRGSDLHSEQPIAERARSPVRNVRA